MVTAKQIESRHKLAASLAARLAGVTAPGSGGIEELSDELWLDVLEEMQKLIETEIDSVTEGLDEKQYAEQAKSAISRDEEQ